MSAGGMARYVEDFDLECADGEVLAILEELRLKTLALRSEKYRPAVSLQLQGTLDTRMAVPPMATTLEPPQLSIQSARALDLHQRPPANQGLANPGGTSHGGCGDVWLVVD